MNAFAHFLLTSATVKITEEQGTVQFRFEGPIPTEHVVIEITNPDQATRALVQPTASKPL